MSNMATNRLTIAPVSNSSGQPAPMSNRLLDAKYFQNHSPPMAFDSNSHGFKPLQSLTTRINNPSSTTASTATITSSSMDTGINNPPPQPHAKTSAPIKSNLLTNATNTTSANGAGQLYNGARLNKQLIQQPSTIGSGGGGGVGGHSSTQQTAAFTALIPSKSTPPIASAYFPN